MVPLLFLYDLLHTFSTSNFMSCNLCIYLAPSSIIYSSPGPHCCCVVWASATHAATWLRHRMNCTFLLERREPNGVPSPCGHSCMVCATVCLTVVIVFRHNRRFNCRPQFQDRQKPHPPISYFMSRSTETTL